MALPQSALSELLESFRTGTGSFFPSVLELRRRIDKAL